MMAGGGRGEVTAVVVLMLCDGMMGGGGGGWGATDNRCADADGYNVGMGGGGGVFSHYVGFSQGMTDNY